MSSVGSCLRGVLFANIDGEWREIGAINSDSDIVANYEDEMISVYEEYLKEREYEFSLRPVETNFVSSCYPLTKKQAKKALKYEKNPMARKELQRIISAKEW